MIVSDPMCSYASIPRRSRVPAFTSLLASFKFHCQAIHIGSSCSACVKSTFGKFASPSSDCTVTKRSADDFVQNSVLINPGTTGLFLLHLIPSGSKTTPVFSSVKN